MGVKTIPVSVILSSHVGMGVFSAATSVPLISFYKTSLIEFLLESWKIDSHGFFFFLNRDSVRTK